MTLKSDGRKLGRLVRRATGLPLPVAMSVAKKMLRGGFFTWDFPEALRPFVCDVVVSRCECCGPMTKMAVEGPKGRAFFGDLLRDLKK